MGFVLFSLVSPHFLDNRFQQQEMFSPKSVKFCRSEQNVIKAERDCGIRLPDYISLALYTKNIFHILRYQHLRIYCFVRTRAAIEQNYLTSQASSLQVSVSYYQSQRA